MSKSKTVTVISSQNEETGNWSAVRADVGQFGRIAAKDAKTRTPRICQAMPRANRVQLELESIAGTGELKVKVAA